MSIIHFFFFSSRRRHTRCLSDWSSDVCSSDLGRKSTKKAASCAGRRAAGRRAAGGGRQDRSEERRVGKSVDLGGRRVTKQKRNATPNLIQLDMRHLGNRIPTRYRAP